MAKNRMHKVDMTEKNPFFVGTIDMNKLRSKARKPQPPPVQRHVSKTDYKQKPKHPTQED